MKRVALIATIFLLLSCNQPPDRDCGVIEMPPAQYMGDKASTRIIWMSAALIDAKCRALGTITNEKGTFMACTGRDGLGWFHIMPQDGAVRDLGCLLIHEQAHLPPNAWPWDHPGGHY